MPDYTPAIDAQISESLRIHGRVLPSDLAGIDDAEAARHLQHYIEVHGAEVSLAIRDGALTWGEPASDGKRPSPVDQVLAAPQGKALLDAPASGAPVNPGFWALPVLLGLVGGIIAWLLVKDDNPRAARFMLMLGVILSVVSACLGFALAMGPLATLSTMSGGSDSSVVWPVSSSGRPVLYYFGTAT